MKDPKMIVSLWFFGLVIVIKMTKSVTGNTTPSPNTTDNSSTSSSDGTSSGMILSTASLKITTPLNITTPLDTSTSKISSSYYKLTKLSSKTNGEVIPKGNRLLDSLNSFADKCHGLFLVFFSMCLILYICSKTIKPMKRLVTRIKVRRRRKKETKYQKWLAVYSRNTGEVNCTPGSSLKTLWWSTEGHNRGGFVKPALFCGSL